MRPRPWPGDRVRCVFVDPVTGAGVGDDGRPLDVVYGPQGGRMRVGGLLATADAYGARRVFLTGGPPPSRAWFDEPPPDGWTPAGHFYQLRDPCGRWRSPGGDVVEVRRVAAWFGEGDYTPAEAREAMRLVATLLRTATRGRVGLMGSPAAVGASLWADSLGRDATRLVDQVDDDLAALIRSTSPQHREEVIGRCFDSCDEHLPAPRGKVPALHYFDAVFMYAACARELGAAPVARLDSPRLAAAYWQEFPYARARYRVRFTVPADWTAAGVLPVKHANGRNWHYPNRPGVTGETWCDAAELHVAASNGWHVEPVELLRFDDKARPLDTFTDRVVRLRELAEGEHGVGRPAAMASAAFRSAYIRAIGGFHSRGRETRHVVAAGDPLPADVTEWETRDDGSRVFNRRSRPTGNAAAFQRPELSSQVWARSRARVTRRMLDVDPTAVVAVWGDAMYLTHDVGWSGTRPGEFRRKAGLVGPVARPSSIGDLLRLRERMRDERSTTDA